MAWGRSGAGAAGIDEFLTKLRANSLSSLTLLRFRRLEDQVGGGLCARGAPRLPAAAGRANAGRRPPPSLWAERDPLLLPICPPPLAQTQDVLALCAALQHNTSLSELTISSHTLSTVAARALGAMLAANATLTSVSLGNSAFGSAGMAALAPGLAANRGLTRLDCESKVRPGGGGGGDTPGGRRAARVGGRRRTMVTPPWLRPPSRRAGPVQPGSSQPGGLPAPAPQAGVPDPQQERHHSLR